MSFTFSVLKEFKFNSVKESQESNIWDISNALLVSKLDKFKEGKLKQLLNI